MQRALHLGQIELLLMLLIVWDLCQPDHRWWKGAGIGLAAGIKLVPLIFIPYLVLAGKLRQAAVATAAFLGTVVIGFTFLPHASAQVVADRVLPARGQRGRRRLAAEPVAARPGRPGEPGACGPRRRSGWRSPA